MKFTSFAELALCEPIQRAVALAEYSTPTPIQAEAIPHVLQGRDLLGCAQTGTGKTAAFALPILHRLDEEKRTAAAGRPLALVLSPTRELAAQIGESFQTYGQYLRLRSAVIFGGVSQQPQVRAISRGVHVLIATPGRLLDLMQQGHVRLDAVRTLVLDEADRMLDMGFLPDLRRIIAAVPRQRQSLFFSATMPIAVAELAGSLLTNPVRVAVNPVASTVERIDQRVVFAEHAEKRSRLNSLLQDDAFERVLIFTRTKRRADVVVRHLRHTGLKAEAIHGNKSQNARQRALESFRHGRIRALIATDIAARGLDVDGISHVINYDLPNEPENYVHRIGRTARAGAGGVAISFCDSTETAFLRAIQRLIRQDIPVENGSQPATVQVATPGTTREPASSGRRPKSAAASRRRRPRSRSNAGGRRSVR